MLRARKAVLRMLPCRVAVDWSRLCRPASWTGACACAGGTEREPADNTDAGDRRKEDAHPLGATQGEVRDRRHRRVELAQIDASHQHHGEDRRNGCWPQRSARPASAGSGFGPVAACWAIALARRDTSVGQ